MGNLSELKFPTAEGYPITLHHTAVFFHPGECERCRNQVEIRFKVQDTQKQVGFVCGVCAWVVSLGMALQLEAFCRACGCSDNASCPTGCSWVELDRAARIGLCSNCARKESA